MAEQHNSQTLAPLRAPALAEKESHEVGNNPLLWRLGRYRLWGRVPVSRIAVEHLLFGLGIAALMLALPLAAPALFDLRDFNLLASVAIGLHMFWMSMRVCYRMDALFETPFFDEMLLTAMTPREIAGALAQSASRPMLASLAGMLGPLYAASLASTFGEGCPGAVRFSCISWGVLAPFVALSVFSMPWVLLWGSLAGPLRGLGAKLVAHAWPAVLPAAAIFGNTLATAIAAGLLVFAALNAALLAAPRVPAMLADRESAPSGGKSLTLSEGHRRRAARV